MDTRIIKIRPLEFTINAVIPNGPALQYHCKGEQVYYVSYGLSLEQLGLYRQLRVLLERDSQGNRRKVVDMLKQAGFDVTQVD